MKEAVYDSEISPLMKQIIAICKREKIGLLACFSIGGDEKPGYQYGPRGGDIVIAAAITRHEIKAVFFFRDNVL